MRKKAFVIVCLLGLIGIFYLYSQKSNSLILGKETDNLTELQSCEHFFNHLEWQRHHVYCQDINFCPEPCWQYYEKTISDCLELRGETVTEDRIQSYLIVFPAPSFFEESRQLCSTWAKTKEEQEQCLKNHSSSCF